MVNRRLVEDGYAYAYTSFPFALSDEFLQLQREARLDGRGLWAGGLNGTGQKRIESAQPRYDPDGPDRDCGDFLAHAEAQAFFEASGPGDPHRLDADSDGVACESLP